MATTAVTSKGQVTIPQEVRRKLGIRKGSRMAFSVVGDHVEMRLASQPEEVAEGGFGMLRSQRKAVSADFDPATLLQPEDEQP